MQRRAPLTAAARNAQAWHATRCSTLPADLAPLTAAARDAQVCAALGTLPAAVLAPLAAAARNAQAWHTTIPSKSAAAFRAH